MASRVIELASIVWSMMSERPRKYKKRKQESATARGGNAKTPLPARRNDRGCKCSRDKLRTGNSRRTSFISRDIVRKRPVRHRTGYEPVRRRFLKACSDFALESVTNRAREYFLQLWIDFSSARTLSPSLEVQSNDTAILNFRILVWGEFRADRTNIWLATKISAVERLGQMFFVEVKIHRKENQTYLANENTSNIFT